VALSTRTSYPPRGTRPERLRRSPRGRRRSSDRRGPRRRPDCASYLRIEEQELEAGRRELSSPSAEARGRPASLFVACGRGRLAIHSLGAMDTGRSGAATGGSARTPVQPGGHTVFRGSAERLPRLPPQVEDACAATSASRPPAAAATVTARPVARSDPVLSTLSLPPSSAQGAAADPPTRNYRGVSAAISGMADCALAEAALRRVQHPPLSSCRDGGRGRSRYGNRDAHGHRGGVRGGEAGFSAVEVLRIENDFWRFYRLLP
jgi:hypothetical protein